MSHQTTLKLDIAAGNWYTDNEPTLIKFMAPLELALIDRDISNTVELYDLAGDSTAENVIILTIKHWG